MTQKIAVAFGLGIFLIAAIVPAVHAGADPGAVCKQKKAKAAGKQAFDLAKAFGKNEKKPNPGKLDGATSKARSKYTKSWTKAESKGGCETSEDADAIQEKVDAFVLDVVEELCPPSPSGAFLDTTSGALE
jgi:hypothetical protein